MEIIVNSLILGHVRTNTYIVSNSIDNTCILIDCGENAKQIIDYVSEHSLQPLAILLTHGHFDHCGCCMEVSQFFNIDIYCHSNDVELARAASTNYWNIKVTDCIVTKPFDNIEKLTFGLFNFKILHVPGHTVGSVCYIIDKYLFSGDTLFKGDIGSTAFPGADKSLMPQSLNLLYNLDVDYYILSGHGKPSTLFYEKLHNKEFRR